jgi:hypothetical protein
VLVTAKQWVVSGQLTAMNVPVTPGVDCRAQLAPPSVVARIVPLPSATPLLLPVATKHTVALGQLIPQKVVELTRAHEFWYDDHVAPPSAVARTSRSRPTAKQVEVVGQLTLRMSPKRFGDCLAQPEPPLLVASTIP